MKKSMLWMAAAGLLLPAVDLAAQEPGPKQEPPQPPPQGRLERQMEKAAFLGVAVSPAPSSLRAQLGVPQGTGLLVLHVEPESASAGKLQEHDVLLRFNDQILVNQDQLTTLVYNAGIGTEVKITCIRMKNEETVSVVLGEREVPKGMFGMGDLGWWNPGEPWHRRHEDLMRDMKGRAAEMRERAEERMRDLREKREQQEQERPESPRGVEPKRGEPDRGQPGRAEPDRGQPGRAEPDRGQPGRMPVVKHSTWVEDGLILNLVESSGSKRLTVEKNGEKVFEGPVDTEEQRQKVPQEYREKLDKMGAMPAPKNKPEQEGDIL